MTAYHDREWGVPVHDDRTLFEFLVLEGAQAGLSWQTSGVASSALRFYEDKGLITSQRSGRGHRRYPRAVLRRVAFIVFAQKVGLSLEEIGTELSKLPGHHVPERSDWAKLSGTWTKRI